MGDHQRLHPNEIGIVIQARLGSTRLGKKILLEAAGKTMLEHQIERLKKVGVSVIIATTDQPLDDQIAELAEREGIPYFRGSEEDVLDRTYKAAKENDLHYVIRITSDRPLIDPALISEAILSFEGDYVANNLEKGIPVGMEVEICTMEALKTAWKEALDPYEREHVTPFIKRRPERFKIKSIRSEVDNSGIRLTLDTPEDYKLIKAIFDELYPPNPTFTLDDILSLLKQHPDWLSWNRHILQKS